MATSLHFTNPPCPHLPQIDAPLPITHTRKHRQACGTDYFLACLELAHSLWRCSSPAQAILQLDKSFMAETQHSHSDVYKAIIWIIQNAPAKQFLGNPVRHFQHLASRMNMHQPNAELRIWRAWACLHITEKFSTISHPRDQEQIRKEGLTIPTVEQVLENITSLADPEEIQLLEEYLSY